MTRSVASSTTLNRILLVVLALATVVGFAVVPLETSLPVHWNLAGEADAFAPAAVALLLPALMAGLVMFILFLTRRFAPEDYKSGRHVIDAVVTVITLLAIILLAATIALGLGHAIEMPRLLAIAIGAMWLVVGNYLPKTQSNAVAGVRLPWTMRDAGNWRVTHRWTGRLMMLAGAMVLLVALANPAPEMLFSTLALAVVGPVLASVVISYGLSRRSRG
ncbi:Uncharacterized membrane protein [Devosia lucknowensis]|uniref:Uncharacterized membrane protein n=1 Tax=Devosia lucknowensis TaxID=1096929 RepID=A0A1Y6ERV8_9HYPH|nr:SdpI family protein [Devosia lucknowensis]SMQ63232.1 Uncharacterized membrane protein [Devosia lucknowensis]